MAEQKFDVHVFAVVRVKVVNIEAGSHAEAIELAEKKVWDCCRLFDGEYHVPEHRVGIASTELADGEAPTSYLVDEQGDVEYERSKWYNSDRSAWEPAEDTFREQKRVAR